MNDPLSRHTKLATYKRPLQGSKVTVELYQPRFRERATADRFHSFTGSDRPDLLAQRYLSDPMGFWAIADANPDSELEQLLQPGRVLNIPRET